MKIYYSETYYVITCKDNTNEGALNEVLDDYSNNYNFYSTFYPTYEEAKKFIDDFNYYEKEKYEISKFTFAIERNVKE